MVTETQAKAQRETPSLRGKSALITGGTTGIGRATAIKLASEGCRVLIFGRHQNHLDDALNAIRPISDEVYGLTADQSRHEDVLRVFEEVDHRFERLDILIDNAAVSGDSVLEQDDWRYVVESNLIGYMDCAREGARRMRTAGGGHIVLIGSVSAMEREADSDSYVATKAGIQAFAESFAKLVRKDGIKVTLIEPGLVGSDLISVPPEKQPEMIERKEMLKAEDIAEGIWYALTQPPRCNVASICIRPLIEKE